MSFEPVDLAFYMALAPRESESFTHGVDIPFEASGEAGQGGTPCSLKPSPKRLQAAVAEDARGKLGEPTDLG